MRAAAACVLVCAAVPAAAYASPAFGGAATAGSAAGSTIQASVAPSFSTLNASQVQARQHGKREHMIVVFNNQIPNQPADPAHMQARETAASSMQAPLVAQLKQVGATQVRKLSLLNSVSATMPATEAKALANNPGVKEVVPDANVTIGDATPSNRIVSASQVANAATSATAADTRRLCNADPNRPLLEPEGLASIHDASDDPTAPDEASSIATGRGVVVGVVNADTLAGNPNMIRPDGEHVIINAPDPVENESGTAANPAENTFDPEANGEDSTIAGQGTVTYSYASQLPYASLPANCSFRILGDAPGASLLSTGYFENSNSTTGQIVAPVSQVMAGLQQAVSEGADVVSESYGIPATAIGFVEADSAPLATVDAVLAQLNDAMTQAGVVVVESAGNSGSTASATASDDPGVIDVAGTNDLRLLAQAYGYTKGWEDDSIATLSTGGTAPIGAVVDLAAPASPSLAAAGAGLGLPTYSFEGTNESAPFVAGAAADVIQAYRDSHGGASPTPAQVKEILTSTATDLGAPADQQGAGLVNVYAAVEAARQMPGTSAQGSSAPALVESPTQLDVHGDGGSTVNKSVTLYNASSHAETVTGNYRVLGGETHFGSPVTENVSAPSAGASIPAQGATAAAPIHFTVPKGTDVLDADMRWPDATNSDANALAFILTDPAGKLAQISYDVGAGNDRFNAGPGGASPDIQHGTVEHPMAGTWTAQIVWANGAAGGVTVPPITPGSYTGTVTFQATGQKFTTTPASAPVTIAPQSSATVPLDIALPKAPGDTPESVQFTTPDGLSSSVPIARRTLIPSTGGSFNATLTSSVSRGPGQVKTFWIDVPAGEKDLEVSLHAQDHNADDPVYYYLYGPNDGTLLVDGKPQLAVDGLVSSKDAVTSIDATPGYSGSGNASLIATNPSGAPLTPGLYEIDVMQGATTDGTRFSQRIHGTVAYNQLAPETETGLPTSTSTTIACGASVPVNVTVKNTTNHVGMFVIVGVEGTTREILNGDVFVDGPAPFDPNAIDCAGNGSTFDITGGNGPDPSGDISSPLELAPGATGTLTATLSPNSEVGQPVIGDLAVLEVDANLAGVKAAIAAALAGDGELHIGGPFDGLPITSAPILDAFDYEYTVGPSQPEPWASSLDNAGITNDNQQFTGGLDGNGASYSEQALTAAGLAPGTLVKSGDLQYQWPNAAPGQPDNVLAGGQTISVPPVAGATELGIMGTATNGETTAPVVITYTDGTTQPATLDFADWADGSPASGTTTVATMPYDNNAAGSPQQGDTSVFSTEIDLQPGKTVASVTLGEGTPGQIHVFALGTDKGPLTTS